LGEWPKFSEDEVLDFMVKEAVIHRGKMEEAEMQKAADQKAERDAWRKEGLSPEQAAMASPRGG
jgi:hypothetical protein